MDEGDDRDEDDDEDEDEAEPILLAALLTHPSSYHSPPTLTQPLLPITPPHLHPLAQPLIDVSTAFLSPLPDTTFMTKVSAVMGTSTRQDYTDDSDDSGKAYTGEATNP